MFIDIKVGIPNFFIGWPATVLVRSFLLILISYLTPPLLKSVILPQATSPNFEVTLYDLNRFDRLYLQSILSIDSIFVPINFDTVIVNQSTFDLKETYVGSNYEIEQLSLFSSKMRTTYYLTNVGLKKNFAMVLL